MSRRKVGVLRASPLALSLAARSMTYALAARVAQLAGSGLASRALLFLATSCLLTLAFLPRFHGGRGPTAWPAFLAVTTAAGAVALGAPVELAVPALTILAALTLGHRALAHVEVEDEAFTLRAPGRVLRLEAAWVSGIEQTADVRRAAPTSMDPDAHDQDPWFRVTVPRGALDLNPLAWEDPATLEFRILPTLDAFARARGEALARQVATHGHVDVGPIRVEHGTLRIPGSRVLPRAQGSDAVMHLNEIRAATIADGEIWIERGDGEPSVRVDAVGLPDGPSLGSFLGALPPPSAPPQTDPGSSPEVPSSA